MCIQKCNTKNNNFTEIIVNLIKIVNAKRIKTYKINTLFLQTNYYLFKNNTIKLFGKLILNNVAATLFVLIYCSKSFCNHCKLYIYYRKRKKDRDEFI